MTIMTGVDVEPHMRRALLTAGDLDDFTHKPGQAVVLMVPRQGGETGRRDYTIRRFDLVARMLSIDVFLDGDTPAPARALTAKPGDWIEARGPRCRSALTCLEGHRVQQGGAEM